jgi:hypothetical protein
MEIYRPLLTETELAHMRETREQWQKYLERKRQELESCKGGSYRVVLSRPGMVHASFGDEPLLTAAQQSTEVSDALSILLLIERINRAFLGKYLKRETPVR